MKVFVSHKNSVWSTHHKLFHQILTKTAIGNYTIVFLIRYSYVEKLQRNERYAIIVAVADLIATISIPLRWRTLSNPLLLAIKVHSSRYCAPRLVCDDRQQWSMPKAKTIFTADPYLSPLRPLHPVPSRPCLFSMICSSAGHVNSVTQITPMDSNSIGIFN